MTHSESPRGETVLLAGFAGHPRPHPRGKALTVLLFVLPFSAGTAGTVWLGAQAPARYVSRLVIERIGTSARGEEEIERMSRSRAEFQTIVREIQSFNRIEQALLAMTERGDEEAAWQERIESVRRDVDVAFAGLTRDDGYTFTVRFRGSDPVFGPRFLRELGEQFLSQANERKHRQLDQAVARIDARLTTTARELAGIQERLAPNPDAVPAESDFAGDDGDVSSPSDLAAARDEGELRREYQLKRSSYRELLEKRSRLGDLQRQFQEDTPPFQVLSWPGERGEEIRRRVSGLAILAGAVGSVLGLIGALGSMLIQNARASRRASL
jgi:hypothetical protein